MSTSRRDLLRIPAALALAPLLAEAARVPGAAAQHSEKPATEKPAPYPKTGGVKMLPVRGGKHRVWTKKVGNGALPMLTLHGGPGVPHDYLECFEDFLPQAGVKYWYYDQLGCGNSDLPEDPGLWTVDGFREEVEEVRTGLGLSKFVLFGHSWGGMLGIEYALKYQQNLKALVISDMTASIASYMAYIGELRKTWPKDVVETMARYEAKGDYENPEYQKVVFETLYTKYLCRTNPWPEPVERAFKKLATKVYGTMQGPNEFVITGNFKNWDRWADLPKIKVPVLLLAARHDTMSVKDKERMAKLIPNSRLVVCENGSHLAMYDDQEAYFKGLVGFLKDVATGKA